MRFSIDVKISQGRVIGTLSVFLPSDKEGNLSPLYRSVQKLCNERLTPSWGEEVEGERRHIQEFGLDTLAELRQVLLEEGAKMRDQIDSIVLHNKNLLDQLPTFVRELNYQLNNPES